MERYICIHGHFYQPPRESPAIEAIEVQDSAYPYHDWNERITAECYGPNTASRVLDADGRIVKIASNYAKLSFDFGPTLLSWMARVAPDVYQSLIAADRESQRSFSGHGSAISQVYNHMILPLANEADKRTQVLWGISDFKHRFGRFPEGMWLPETAVDIASLEALAEAGVRFTILAPHQAKAVRKMGEGAWRDVHGGRIDPTMAYLINLPSGRTINVFFYDGPISRGVAFEGLLSRGENFANRLMEGFSDSRAWPQLVHIATDGESYGHHHPHGDMALAYALDYIESHNLAHLTNYGEYLEKVPPTHEVEILENTSWSCAHGIERWKSDCGCNSGGHPGWNQAWRDSLREALDWLQHHLAAGFDRRGRKLFRDPWLARDEYISVVLDRSPENVERFLRQHAIRDPNGTDKVRMLKLLEMQRHAMLMYTSCGWFFDEISGIETAQILQFAGRAIQLAREALGESLQPRFLELLEQAKSNIPEQSDGRRIYEKWVKPALVGLPQVGAHYAMTSLFENEDERSGVYCYTVEREDYRVLSSGKVRLALGKARITSDITQESKRLSFGVLHLGDHNLSGGVRELNGEGSHETATEEVGEAFSRGDLAELVRVMDRSFGSQSYSVKQLFRDQQRQILGTIVNETLGEDEAVYKHIYEHHAPIMRFLIELGTPLPKAWHAAAELVINNRLRRAFESAEMDLDNIAAVLAEAKKWQVTLDRPGLSYALRKSLVRMAELMRTTLEDVSHLEKMGEVVDMVRSLPFEVDLWKTQNIYYEMLQSVPTLVRKGAWGDNAIAQRWLHQFSLLGEKLRFGVPEMMKESQNDTAATIMTLAEEVARQRSTPRATYRLQFNSDFKFKDAQALVRYLDELGISDCYASPLLKSRAGSSHGYDVCDHGQLNPVLGDENDFEAFSAELQARKMGLILDVVPNHMAISEPSNVWWMDVLENGPSSIYSNYFDIDWRPVKLELHNKVLLPILEDQYGKVLESGKLRLAYEDGGFFIHYYGIKLPVTPCTYSQILQHQLGTLSQALGEDSEYMRELRSILTALSYLPPSTVLSDEKIAEHNREKEVIKGRIASIYEGSAYVRAAVDMAVKTYNGVVGDPRSFDLLDNLIDAQVFRPAFWRVAAEEINYRRFFDVNELAAIRVELPEVFKSTHQFILQLLAKGKVSGLRVDHPDGLWDPRNYFRLLQESYVTCLHRLRLGHQEHNINEDCEWSISGWLGERPAGSDGSAPSWPLYVVAEKILGRSESLPQDWAVDGTTGYDYLNSVNGIFVNSGNARAFARIYGQFVGSEVKYQDLINSAKKMIMLVSLASEINELCHQLERIAEKNRLYRDFTLNSLTFAVREVVAALPVYRTYITGPGPVSPHDQSYLEAAIAEAKRRNPRTATAVFDFVGDTLLLRNLHNFPEEARKTLLDLVMKFQQVTGPVMAKGVEDTSFYRYNRLVSLNEVGGQPDRFGSSVAAFHQQNLQRQKRWTHTMLATSTHDTKRSEDVRARISVLSEMPGEWRAALSRWSKLNAGKKTLLDEGLAPDRNDEYLLYQTLLGTIADQPMSDLAYVQYRERITAYMEKAIREAKVHTSWINPNEQYETAVQSFVAGVLSSNSSDPFIADLLSLNRLVAYYGRFNSLSQLLLKLTSPGVPDIYQGAELWDYSLVDPDNRRPVDYQRRISLLAEIKSQMETAGQSLAAFARELVDTGQDGRIKLYTTYRALGFRRTHADLFEHGGYVPLQTQGDEKDHLCAFARISEEEAALVVVPRLVFGLTGGSQQPPLGPKIWKATRLVLSSDRPGQRYRNIFTDEELTADKEAGMVGLRLGEILANFPVALLERLGE